MRAGTERVVASLVAGLVLFAFAPLAEAQVAVEATGGMGYAGVDLDKYSSAFARSGRDWSQTSYHFRGLVLPFRFGKLSFGGEFASQSLFWYTYDACPGCDYFLEGTTAIGSKSFMGSGRIDLGRGRFVDFSAGLFLMGGEPHLGSAGAFGYAFPVNEKLTIPIKFRTDFVFGELVAPAVSVGIAFKL